MSFKGPLFIVLFFSKTPLEFFQKNVGSVDLGKISTWIQDIVYPMFSVIMFHAKTGVAILYAWIWNYQNTWTNIYV